jgi:predicted DNA-binding transcriptional regulator YafY
MPQKCVRLSYQSARQNEPIQRDLDAYALAFRQGWWYVIGFCHLRQEMRSFRIDRIHQIQQLEANYQIPADFDAQKYLIFEIPKPGSNACAPATGSGGGGFCLE